MDDPRVAELIRQLGAIVSARAGIPPSDSLCAIHQQIVSVLQQRNALADVVDHLRIGVILAERSGEVLWTNRAAREMLSGAHPTSLESLDAAAIERLVMGATVQPAGSLARSRGKRATAAIPTCATADGNLQIVVARSRSDRPSLREQPVAMYVADSHKTVRVDPDVLRRLYGLTPAETRVLLLLISGAAVPQVARMLTITENTTRWHVKHILVKTSAATQAQAMRNVIGGLASLRFD